MNIIFAIIACFVTDNSALKDTSIAASNTMQQYKLIYCEDYASRCNLYTSIEECEDQFDSRYPSDCRIVDKELFDICVDWLMSLDCAVDELTIECEQFYECS